VRPPQLRASFLAPDEIVIDSFAGGGGASCGIEEALERPVDIAINHDPKAIAMHAANHAETRHYCEDVWAVDPREACGSRRVGLLWASPDCKHFSRAKGAKPVSKNIRGLAWVVTRWARAVRPRIIFLENVEEFEDWGPLGPDNRPIPEKLGKTFRAWVAQLRNLGYDVQWRTLVAADYGAPTTRKRLYLIARSDGQPIVWPEPTHGQGRAQPWRTAAEIIDWSIAGRSIFNRQRPLKEATLRRIAMGIQRYVIGAARPFVIPVTHQGDARAHSADEPLRTITGAHRGELALIEPFMVRHGHYSTKTGAGLEPIPGGPGVFRGQSLRQPVATICATEDKHIVAPIITKHYGGVVGHDVNRPIGTITAVDHHAVTAAFLTKFYGTSTGAAMTAPLPTVTSQGQHLAEVRAFLIKYYGAAQGQQQGLFDPLHTVTTKARFGLVEVHGEQYQISDIAMRMLVPRELFRGQGFPDDYRIDIEHYGRRLTKEDQTRMAGNSVCRDVARALVRANVAGESAVAA
jgi:DNA (cytosine-5)-methyltransferase 1